MSAALISLTLDIATMLSALLLGARLLLSYPRRRSAQLIALICVCNICYVALSRYDYRYWIPAPFHFEGLQHLNKGSRVLSHFNEAILPIYVLHQPILLIGAFYVFPLELPLPLEAFLLVCITGLGALAIYEIGIRPFSVIRILFGLKAKWPSITAATP